jgi:transposase-like protein
MGQEKSRGEIVEEYLAGGISIRKLSGKYGVTRATLHRWIMAHQSGLEIEVRRPEAMREMPKDIKRLQRELYEARLEAKLYKTMIDIAEKDLGVPIRKKRGAKQ